MITRPDLRKPRHSAGFTLLELMVVLVLIGIIFSFAVLSLKRDAWAESMQMESRRLTALLQLARDEAILTGTDVAVRFTEEDYEFMSMREGQWTAVKDDPILRQRALPSGMYLELELEGNPPDDEMSREKRKKLPQVFLLSSGEITPFTLTFRAPETEKVIVYTATLVGDLSWELVDEF